MKITFLTPNLELHGGNLVMLKYANYLAKSGHSVTIISSNKKTLEDINPKIKLLLYEKFPIKYVDFFLLQKVYYSKIIKLIDECDFLIPIYTPLLPAVIKAKKVKKLNAKILFLFQDFFEMVWAGPWIKWALSKKKLTDPISLVMCVSKSSEKALKSVSDVRTVVIKNGVDTEFKKRSLKKQNFILFVGRPQKPKGFHIFKEAYQILKKTYPDLKARVIAPSVKDGNFEGIEFIKYKDRKQIANLYNKASVYVNTSLGESFGLPALEAMASGTPVVLTDTVGGREYAIDRQNCLVTSVSNATETADAVHKILSNKKLAEKLTLNGIKTSERYSWKYSLDEFLKLISSLNSSSNF